jgi:glycosyltransferase involved in cell wall biosynthesis
LWSDGPDAAAGIVDAIARLDADRPALVAMSRAARTTFEDRYTADGMAAQIEAYYRGVVAASGAPP